MYGFPFNEFQFKEMCKLEVTNRADKRL